MVIDTTANDRVLDGTGDKEQLLEFRIAKVPNENATRMDEHN
jgi:hypothetical protein